jgi:hypothetical protein
MVVCDWPESDFQLIFSIYQHDGWCDFDCWEPGTKNVFINKVW